MEFTAEEIKELDKLVAKVKPRPVKGSYLWRHLMEFLWYEHYQVPIECQYPFVVSLIRERDQLKKDLSYLRTKTHDRYPI